MKYSIRVSCGVDLCRLQTGAAVLTMHPQSVRIKAQGLAPDISRAPMDYPWTAPVKACAVFTQPAQRKRQRRDSDHLALHRADRSVARKISGCQKGIPQMYSLRTTEKAHVAVEDLQPLDRDALAALVAAEDSPVLERDALATEKPSLRCLQHLYLVAHRVRKLLTIPRAPSGEAAMRMEARELAQRLRVPCSPSTAYSNDSASVPLPLLMRQCVMNFQSTLPCLASFAAEPELSSRADGDYDIPALVDDSQVTLPEDSPLLGSVNPFKLREVGAETCTLDDASAPSHSIADAGTQTVTHCHEWSTTVEHYHHSGLDRMASAATPDRDRAAPLQLLLLDSQNWEHGSQHGCSANLFPSDNFQGVNRWSAPVAQMPVTMATNQTPHVVDTQVMMHGSQQTCSSQFAACDMMIDADSWLGQSCATPACNPRPQVQPAAFDVPPWTHGSQHACSILESVDRWLLRSHGHGYSKQHWWTTASLVPVGSSRWSSLDLSLPLQTTRDLAVAAMLLTCTFGIAMCLYCLDVCARSRYHSHLLQTL